MFQISVNCGGSIDAASCAKCPNGQCEGDCQSIPFSIDKQTKFGPAILPANFCVSEYFERYLSSIYSELPNKQACLLSLYGNFFHHTVNVV